MLFFEPNENDIKYQYLISYNIVFFSGLQQSEALTVERNSYAAMKNDMCDHQ